MRIEDVLNREIIIKGYKITSSKYKNGGQGRCLKLQFELDGVPKILFTGSEVLAEQTEKYKDEMPFIATIVKIDKFYSFS